MNTPRLFLIDGSGYLYRAFYGVQRLSRRDGFPTNAIFGFFKMVRKVVEDHQPEYLAVTFDAKGPTFRHHLDGQYKIQRKPMPDELRVQVPVIRELVEALRVPVLEMPGFEADDVLGTLALRGVAKGFEVVIVTGDKDLMQLVRPGLRLLDTGKDKWIDAPEVEAFWGVPPEQVVEVMALSGDSSDNIPGVPQIGVKTGAELIRTFGTLENLLARTSQITQPKRRENLENHGEQARLSRTLATIDCAVPVALELEALRRQPPDREALRRIFLEMEFHSLLTEWSREEGESPMPPPPTPDSPPVTGEEPPPLSYRAVTDEAGFQELLDALRGRTAFALDTETTGLDPVQAELVGISLAWRPREAFYIPVGHAPETVPDGQLPRERVLAALKPLLEDPTVAKTGQNLKYEAVVLDKYGIRLAGIQRDAMLFSHLLYGSTRRHNLDAIALEELGRTTTTYKEVTGTGKKQLRFDQVPLERAMPYACEDAEVAWEAAERLERQVAGIPSLMRLYREVELPLLPVLGEMERHGALIDRAALVALSEIFEQRRQALMTEIHALAGEVFNINSPQQLGVVLFEKMAIKGGKRNKMGYVTDVAVLTRLAEQGHPMPVKVLEYRGLTKLQSTYTDALLKLIDPASGRVHTSFNQAATLTGRLSSSDPNLQNIPIRTEEGRAIRAAFIAPPGWVLLSADYSQIELRLLAHMGEVTPIKEAFARGIDIHAATAAELFGGAPEAVTPEQRRMAKTINFGLIYGMSPFGLATRLEIPMATARAYMERYFERYHGVKRYMEQAVAAARERGYAETLLGRRCPVPEIGSSNRTLRELAERTAINAPIQGSAAEVIKLAMIRLHDRLGREGLRSRMILQVHDELVLEVPREELEAVIPLVREAMAGAMALSVPLEVGIGAAPTWAEAH